MDSCPEVWDQSQPPSDIGTGSRRTSPSRVPGTQMRVPDRRMAVEETPSPGNGSPGGRGCARVLQRGVAGSELGEGV